MTRHELLRVLCGVRHGDLRGWSRFTPHRVLVLGEEGVGSLDLDPLPTEALASLERPVRRRRSDPTAG